MADYFGPYSTFYFWPNIKFDPLVNHKIWKNNHLQSKNFKVLRIKRKKSEFWVCWRFKDDKQQQTSQNAKITDFLYIIHLGLGPFFLEVAFSLKSFIKYYFLTSQTTFCFNQNMDREYSNFYENTRRQKYDKNCPKMQIKTSSKCKIAFLPASLFTYV